MINDSVFAIVYTVGNVPQPPALVEAGDASDADATVLLHVQGQPEAEGKPVRIVALTAISAARWAGVPGAANPEPLPPAEAPPAVGESPGGPMGEGDQGTVTEA
jgi:hypothetical protein